MSEVEEKSSMVSQDHERSTSSALEWRGLAGEAWGALNFILAFYEPGQRHLDTNAWKQAEASGRRVHAKLREWLDRPSSAEQVSGQVPGMNTEPQLSTGEQP